MGNRWKGGWLSHLHPLASNQLLLGTDMLPGDTQN